jgi:hypothetical protein
MELSDRSKEIIPASRLECNKNDLWEKEKRQVYRDEG